MPPACVICGWAFNCNCEPEIKADAEYAEDAGLCWLCDKLHENCGCEFAEIRRNRAEGFIDPYPIRESGAV